MIESTETREPYTLREVQHVKDLIGYVSMCAPDDFPKDASVFLRTTDASFATIGRSIDAIKPQVGEKCAAWLHGQASLAQAEFEKGNRREGFTILRNMKAKSWSKKKWVNAQN